MSNPGFQRASWGRGGSSSQRGRGHRGAKPDRIEVLMPSTTPSPPFGLLLTELHRENISQSSRDATIRDCSYVASYSWLDRDSPTVIIPGKPPAWTPPAINRRLEPDKGNFFRDSNAAQYPPYPMEPAVRALLKQDSQFPTKDIDVVTCTSALGNLVRFVHGVDKEFRIILARVGHTVFFIRRENSPTELIPNVKGYGHTFPEEYTTWEKDVKSSKSHQRMIQYRFGGLRLLVRFGVDGYFRKEDDKPDPPAKMNSLLRDLGSASVGKETATGRGRLRMQKGGQPTCQQSIFDIKTRSAFDFKTRTIKKEIDMSDITPRLWISQIPTLVVGFHQRGLFEDIRIQDVRKEIEEWETANRDTLRQLASLLHTLIEFSRTSRTQLEICRSASGSLEIRRLLDESFEALPDDLRARWVEGPDFNQEAGLQDGDSTHSEKTSDEVLSWHAGHDIRGQERESDDESDKDYTACSADVCGYCGHCKY